MAKYQDIEQLYAQIVEQKTHSDELEIIIKDITEADNNGLVYIKLQRNGRILQVGTQNLLDIVLNKKSETDTTLNGLLNKVSIK